MDSVANRMKFFQTKVEDFISHSVSKNKSLKVVATVWASDHIHQKHENTHLFLPNGTHNQLSKEQLSFILIGNSCLTFN